MSNIENLTIMFTDIVGFSRLVSSMSRRESESLLKQHNKLLKRIIKQFRGEHIKSIGDSFLVVFRSPTDAVLCAMAMQDCFWERNHQAPINNNHPISIRIALNTGEVRLAGRDVFGEAVNIAARLESQTPGSEIYFTEAVYLSMNKNEVAMESLGDFTFKGIPEPIGVYRARHKPDPDGENPYHDYPFGGAHYQLKPASRPIFSVGRVFVGLTAAILAAFASWWLTLSYMPTPDSINMDKISVEYRELTDINATSALDFLPDITQEIRFQAQPLLEEKNYLALDNLIQRYASDHPENSYLNLLQGHLAFYNKDYTEAINHYSTALKGNSALSWEPSLAKNLVALLDYDRITVNKILGAYISKPIVTELAIRTGQPGLRARYDAFYLLKDSGNIDKVDKVGLNIWDLRELKECRLKHVAVKELQRLGDPRALTALKEVVDVSFWKGFQYACLRRDAKNAITKIKANSGSDSPSDQQS